MNYLSSSLSRTLRRQRFPDLWKFNKGKMENRTIICTGLVERQTMECGHVLLQCRGKSSHSQTKNIDAKRIDTYDWIGNQTNDNLLDFSLLGLTNDVHCSFNGTLSKHHYLKKGTGKRKINVPRKFPRDPFALGKGHAM